MLSAPVDGFRLAYQRAGSGPPVVLLHGWPGDRTDYEAVVPLLAPDFDVVVPDLRGFGASDKHDEPPAEAYSAAAQAIARDAPERVWALVVSPLIEEVLDGDRAAVRAYLAQFWRHWSGPGFEPGEERLDRLADAYGAPGAMTASIGWYRAGSGMVASSLAETEPEPEYRIATPTTILWQEHDPLFPRAWSDRLDAFFSAVELVELDGAGHFTPVEAPEAFAAAIRAR